VSIETIVCLKTRPSCKLQRAEVHSRIAVIVYEQLAQHNFSPQQKSTRGLASSEESPTYVCNTGAPSLMCHKSRPGYATSMVPQPDR
jgi:hypothetical protein